MTDFMVVLRGYRIKEVDELVRLATDALASTCKETRARAAARLRDTTIRISLRGYDRSQVDSWLRHTVTALT
jgi:hypothetical protein